MAVKRVGIMTGGGDCPGLNPVIRAIVKVGRQRYGWEILGIEDAFHGLVDLDYRSPQGNTWLTEESVRGILHRGGTILGTSNRSDPFNFVVEDGAGGIKTIDVSDRVMENYHKLGLEALISIGGDGSLAIAERFIAKGMKIVGVPKTIDNDLSSTDVTFGFNTAVQIATEAIDRIQDTAQSHDRVILVEVMGRDAGWLALHAGLGGGAHVILLPEIPYEIEPIAAKIRERRERGEPFSVIVVAEGARPESGAASLQTAEPGGMPRLMGAAHRVAEALSPHIRADVRVTVLGHIQRGGTPSSWDRLLGTRFGVAAAELVAEGRFGRMVALRGDAITSVSISEAVDEQKLVTLDSQLIQAARAIGVCFGDSVSAER